MLKSTLVLFLLLPLVLFAYREGPDPGYTGGFGEPTCQECHFDNPLNAPGGSITVSGVPPRYTPGVSYPLTVTIARQGATSGGFQLAARVAGGPDAGMDAGTLAVPESIGQVVIAPTGVHYAEHVRNGSKASAEGMLSWTLEWTAPAASAEAVLLHAAANLANGDASPLGDYIYATAVRSEPEPVTR
jgi:hypothetical protein